MKKTLLLLILSISILSCNNLSEEQRLVHNQKVISGIDKKKADLDKILVDLDKQSESISSEFENVNSFKLGRFSSTKKAQILALEEKSKIVHSFRARTIKLKSQLDLLHKNFEWQEDPKLVLEKVFEIARYKDYETAIFLADPYDENDKDVDGIAYVSAHPIEFKDKFVENFKNGRIIGKPFVGENTAEIEFLFGKNTDRKETMTFVKRNDSWYLYSF